MQDPAKNTSTEEHIPEILQSPLPHAQTPIRQELVLSGILLLLSFVLGGMTHKILREGDHLSSGDKLFSSVLLIGCIPLLIATVGALLTWRQRAVHNTVWRMTAVAGLSLILLGAGYFEAYTW